MTHDSPNYAIRAVMWAFSPGPLCVTVSHTMLPGCQLLKYIVPIMKLFAYNDNTHRISQPQGQPHPAPLAPGWSPS